MEGSNSALTSSITTGICVVDGNTSSSAIFSSFSELSSSTIGKGAGSGGGNGDDTSKRACS